MRTGRETAGPSTTLRSGRDDNSAAGKMAPKAAHEWLLVVPTELSSRPERSVVEGPAVPLPVLTQTLEGHGCLIPEVLRRAGTTSVFEARVFEDLSLLAGTIRRKRVQR